MAGLDVALGGQRLADYQSDAPSTPDRPGSPMDQDGAGRKIGIPYGSNPETCPFRVLQSWMEQAGMNCGPLFRSLNRHGQVQAGRLSGIDVARVVKKLADRAGLDATKFAGHSLRSGHATSAAIAGASERSIMNQTGHNSVQMYGATFAMEACSGRTARVSWGCKLACTRPATGLAKL